MKLLMILLATAFTVACGNLQSTFSGDKSKSKTIDLASTTLNFKLNRRDMSLGEAKALVSCFQKATPDQKMQGKEYVKCDTFRINGKDQGTPNAYFTLKQSNLNQFKLQQLRISHSTKRDSYICIVIKTWFNEVPNAFDSFYFKNHLDRYSMISFCSVDEIPKWGSKHARYKQNRVKGFKKFTEALKNPISIQLNDRPLPRKLNGEIFKGSTLGNHDIVRCGSRKPLPKGVIPNDSSEVIQLGVGAYMGWEFRDNQKFQCQH